MKSVIGVIFFCLSVGNSFSQNDSRIDTIRTWFKQIESHSKSQTIQLFHDIENPNYVKGGSSEVIFYFDSLSGNISKVVETTYYDWHESKTSWYFNDAKCFFIFDESNGAEEMYTAEELNITEEELWQRGGEAKTIIFTENRIYFDENGNCIRYLNKEKTVESSQTEADMSSIKNKSLEVNDPYCSELKDHGEFLENWFEKK